MLTTEIIRRLRSHCGLSRSRCPVRAIAGLQPPARSGEAGHSEFKGGGTAHSPGAAIRAGYRVRYVRSTLAITVGDEWLAIQWSYVGALAARLGMRPDTDLGILADFAEDHNLAVNVPMLRACLLLAEQGKTHGIDHCRQLLEGNPDGQL